MSFLSRVFGKHTNKKVFLTLDMSSASVGGALVALSDGNPPHILFCDRIEIPHQKEPDVDFLITATEKTIDAVLTKAMRRGTPNGIACFFASPWYVAQTRTIHIAKEKPTTITEETLRSIITKEQETFRHSHLAAYAKGFDGAEIIERRIMDVRLDGYSVASPFGKRARDIHASFFVSIVPETAVLRYDERIRRIFPHATITHHTFPFAAFSTLRDHFTNEPDFLLIDVTREITDISMVIDGTLVESVSFPLGTRTLTSTVRHIVHAGEKDVATLLHMHKKGIAEKRTALKMEEALFRAQTEWGEGVTDVFKKLSANIQIPHTIFLIAENGVASFFKQFLEEEKFGQSALTESSFRVRLVDDDMANVFAKSETSARNDPQCALEAAFMARVHTPHH